jgi:hypothetical protein
MRVYMFRASLWCEDCARRYMAEHAKPAHVEESNESSYDSDEWPKGPYANGGGEADSPQHCDACGTFLENVLTADGDSYVRDLSAPFDAPDRSWSEIAQAARAAGQSVLAEWCEFYFAPGM